jgi:putative transposase
MTKLKHYDNLDTARFVTLSERFAFWQRRFYDHNCRTEKSVIEKINYCHNNPVRSGLTETPAEWRWSSYRWYNELKGVEIAIDGVEM